MMTIIRRARRHATSLALISICATNVTAQSRETLETKVTARDDIVYLAWSKDHPWDAMLNQGGAFLQAEYRTKSGRVEVDCLAGGDANARRFPGNGCPGIRGTRDPGHERSLQFHLPSSTTGVPLGSVCLAFQLPNQRRLPLRRANEQRDETSRFRFEEWETAAKQLAGAASATTRVEALRAAVAAKSREVADQQTTIQRNGWSEPGACSAIKAPVLDADSPTRPLAEANEVELVARQVCVMRVWYVDSVLPREPLERRLRVGVVLPPDDLDRLAHRFRQTSMMTFPGLDTRRAQAEAFRRDWVDLAPNVRKYRADIQSAGYTQPHFGSFRDYLGLQSLTSSVGERLDSLLTAHVTPPMTDAAGFIGGSLEAYSRCVVDGQSQLTTALRAAKDAQERNPALRESARQTLVKSCESAGARLATLRGEEASLRADLARAEQDARDAGNGSARANASRLRELNGATCVP